MAPFAGLGVALTATLVLGMAPPATRLVIEVRARPDLAPARYTLECEPPAGTLPDPAGACGRLLAADAPFAPVPAGAMCTQIHGGPARAVVRGQLGGVAVDATFSRQNGCEIRRYDRLMRLLGVPAG